MYHPFRPVFGHKAVRHSGIAMKKHGDMGQSRWSPYFASILLRKGEFIAGMIDVAVSHDFCEIWGQEACKLGSLHEHSSLPSELLHANGGRRNASI
jgi:hypothetical protein